MHSSVPRTLAHSLGVLTLYALLAVSPLSAQEAQFESLFNGETLEGWRGKEGFWRVEDGAITGETTPENPTRGNTFLIWDGGELGDFELQFEFRIEGGNSGVQYRSREVQPFVMSGYQADFDAAGQWTGTLYEEKGRGVLAKRGHAVTITDSGKKERTGPTTAEQEILQSMKPAGWNQYQILAKGPHLVQRVNGKVTIDVTDNQADRRRLSGQLALQLHAGPPMKVQFRNLRLRRLTRTSATSNTAPRKRIAFMAGVRSHGYGSHEHFAGCTLLAKSLEAAYPDYEVVVYRDGWPDDPNAFRGADCLIMYCDGGGRHPVNNHLDQVDQLAQQGVGIVCLHYGVEVPKGEPGNKLLDWIGGYFETHWSVNPHWTAEFTELPKHPITQGVQPFAIEDEWYYHMRFRENMQGVTPILTAIPPAHTLRRKDGPHSNNPHVRAKAGQPQHVAWAAERPDGGRGFGFTGGHFHWNWGDPNFRKLVLNAIVWTAGDNVPAQGVADRPHTMADLQQNQDYDRPANFNPQAWEEKLNLPRSAEASSSSVAPNSDRAPSGNPKKRAGQAARPVAQSPVITSRTPGHRARLQASLGEAKDLYLVVTDAGNGFSCDWADWISPRLTGPQGELKLTELKWKSASSQWGQVRIGKNAGGGPLKIAGQSYDNGIGTHAASVIHYVIPAGYDRFEAEVGLDEGGTSQGNCGAQASVQFAVYTAAPRLNLARENAGQADSQQRNAENALAGLDVAEGVEATLFASEPQLLSLTNLDIDHRGRVWVCEVVNYRGNNGKRPEGDRILILEDTDHDGIADRQQVYYQGRDVDSAMGICVLGNRVIVSCSPNILVFTDEDGDDRPDKKEVLFTKTGRPQHDHSAHSFLFGPDGKLYWNFGNTGQAVHDAQGQVVRDQWGHPVVDNGKPYFGGMPFRCNLDGSQFEVLGHNFRNNYEVTVDSFGGLWQSDNDDDGNKGVRINFVMEYGNYGYKDEKTGAGWKQQRTGMSDEIPLRHWHLNDPGVVPNLLQTGAGSPTGITVYEGRLLPKVFWDQILHCDAGPNVVRAYPVTNEGAGYGAEMVNLLHGARDNWFRPADVCVAPDGSVFVTDWYDPGVGGHGMRDLQRGRIFRLAPPGHKYEVPQFDLATPAGAAEALKNPNSAVRFLAWEQLGKQGTAAVPSLLKLAQDPNPRFRARALWRLGKLPAEQASHAEMAIKLAARDRDPNVRMVAIRLARQVDSDVAQVVRSLFHDDSPQVRRELAIALRGLSAEVAAPLWATLALQHDGQDRWYLEALGIGATEKWDACLQAWLDQVGDQWNTAAGRDILWRSRAKATPGYLAKIVQSRPESEHPRYLRAFDFLEGPEKDAALLSILGLE